MDDKIKKAYEKINISEEARNRIEMALMMGEEKDNRRKVQEKNRRWKFAVAACLSAVFLVPTGVFAAQKIYQHFTTSVSEKNYKVDVKIEKKSPEKMNAAQPEKYIKITADFGDEYTIEKEAQGELVDVGEYEDENYDCAMVSYNHKDGFYSGKCFWYELQYMDGDQNEILSSYDVETNQQLEINGRNALYNRYNDVVGSKYSKDHNVDYGQSIYIFVEDYGYIIEMAAQKGLSKSDFIKLASKIQISEAASISDASDYVLYSKRSKASWHIERDTIQTQEIDTDYYYTDGQAEVGETLVKLKDVQVLDSITTLQPDAFITNHFQKKIVSKQGKLKKYDREKIKYGDGVTTPDVSVEKTEHIQPKLVYVTLELEDAASLLGDGMYAAPSLSLVTKEGEKIYLSNDDYNRPEYIQDAFTDHMPCYFEENLGGKQSWFAKITGEKMTVHFAYLVDEDLVNGMALCLNDWIDSSGNRIYLDISQ